MTPSEIMAGDYRETLGDSSCLEEDRGSGTGCHDYDSLRPFIRDNLSDFHLFFRMESY